MVNKKTSTKNIKKPKEKPEQDGVYLLKIVLYFILGCLWVHFGGDEGFSLPVGFLIGVLLASHEHFQIDKKIEYAVLLMATILSFIAPIGFVLSLGK